MISFISARQGTEDLSDVFPATYSHVWDLHRKHLKMSIFQAANLLPVLRARICGYTGIFRIVESF